METTEKTMREIIRELMGQYDAYRTRWIMVNGTDENFNAWFSEVIINAVEGR